MYVYLHILSFKFETKVRSIRVLNREEGAEAGKNGDGKGNMQIKAGGCVKMHTLFFYDKAPTFPSRGFVIT